MGNLFQNFFALFIPTKRRRQEMAYQVKTKIENYTDYYNHDNHITDQFYTNLVKTINWTEGVIKEIKTGSEIDFSKVLRTVNPVYDGQPFYRYEGTWSGFAATPPIPFNYSVVLNEVLCSRTNDALPLADIDRLGQVIEFDIDLTTYDGAPCAGSDGFVDESDIPPIDTWFYITKKRLYCWIPDMFIEKMQDAMAIEIFNSYHWLKDSKPDLNQKIRDRLNPVA